MSAAAVDAGGNVRLVEPVGYFEMLALERNARAVLTDSGGVQREAYFLAVPCVTLANRDGMAGDAADGWNVLAGTDAGRIVAAPRRPRPADAAPPGLRRWPGGDKIVEILERDPPNR